MIHKDDIELYIHIPFCEKKCAYCDFLSFPVPAEGREIYIEALLQELALRSAQAEGKGVRSVFIGGGTPSVLCVEQIKSLMDCVHRHFELNKEAEISIEVNPGSLTKEKLEAYLEAGINRISIGCQSTDEQNLKILDRPYGFGDFLKAYEDTRVCGFSNINVDMIYGLPSQSVESWEKELEFVAELDITHVSVYSLILEEGTRLYEQRGEYTFPSDDESAEMFKVAGEVLQKKGFHRYEISNYAKAGFECIHNLGYWQGVPYIGAGLGAASFDIETRRANTRSFEKYLEGEYSAGIERLSDKDRYSEYIILGLRLTEGISISGFYDKFSRDIFEIFGEKLNSHIKNGTLIKTTDRIRIPEKYLFVSNPILVDFL